jgi:hypothetical protein
MNDCSLQGIASPWRTIELEKKAGGGWQSEVREGRQLDSSVPILRKKTLSEAFFRFIFAN